MTHPHQSHRLPHIHTHSHNLAVSHAPSRYHHIALLFRSSLLAPSRVRGKGRMECSPIHCRILSRRPVMYHLGLPDSRHKASQRPETDPPNACISLNVILLSTIFLQSDVDCSFSNFCSGATARRRTAPTKDEAKPKHTLTSPSSSDHNLTYPS